MSGGFAIYLKNALLLLRVFDIKFTQWSLLITDTPAQAPKINYRWRRAAPPTIVNFRGETRQN